MSEVRAVYSEERMRRLFNPKSVAIIGASERAGSFGLRTQMNLADFKGAVYPVNPRYDEINGAKCYKSIADIPEKVDCVVIATPKQQIEGLVKECIEAGAGGFIVYASGFAELDSAEMNELQARIARLTHEAGTPLVGPNAIGFVNFSTGCGATFMSGLGLAKNYAQPPEVRSIGLASQSGALGFALTQAMERGVYFSHMLACGNSSDVDVADCVNFLAGDPSCKVITCIFEGMANPRRLEDAARNARAAGKPLIVCKMARSESGAKAAASHTGSLAGSHDAYRTMIERSGGIFVDDYDQIMETAQLMAKAPPPKARGVAVIATSGGAAILSADAAEGAGVPLPQPSPEVERVLLDAIPEFGSAANPCDVTAEVINRQESLVSCISAMFSQEDYAAVLVPQALAYEPSIWRIPLVDGLAEKAGKIALMSWLPGWLEGPGAMEAETSRNTALFRSMDRCFRGVRQWIDWHEFDADGMTAPRVSDAAAAGPVAKTLAAASGAITEKDGKAILARYGVPVIEERSAASADDAAAAASGLGFPIVMKIDSADLPHKTEVGGIALGLESPEAVRKEFDAMMARVKAAKPDARLDGVLLQRMAPKGLEIVVGAKQDGGFGPLVVVGLGGVLVELMKDSVAAPAPVTAAQAEVMLRRLKAAQALDGFRDLPPVDVGKLAEIVARISEFAADHADAVEELDVNPLICRGDDIVAVDALIMKKSG